MRIPWSSPPTVSDATKLGLCGVWDNPSLDINGGRIYRLVYQPVIVDDFANLNAWTETDSGTNVNLAGGVVSMDGNGSWNANGIAYTAGIARAVGYLELKFWGSAYAAYEIILGLFPTAALTTSVTTAGFLAKHVSYGSYAYWEFLAGNNLSFQSIASSEWVTLRIYISANTSGGFTRSRVTYESAVLFPTETEVFRVSYDIAGGITNPFYPQMQRYTALPANLLQVKEFRWYSGYAVDGPTLTYVADAGVSYTFNGLDFTNIAATGAWLTTNAKFQYSFDDGVPAYNGSWLTLAQLQAVGAVGDSKRYIRLQVQVNSDGSTQQYAGELNADDGVSGTTGGSIPGFGGITGLTDNADGTLTAAWGAATGEDNFEIHVKPTADFAGADLANRTYLAVAADADTTSQRICNTAGGAKLTAGTTYYVCVRAWNGAGADGNSVSMSVAVTDPLAADGPHLALVNPVGVLLQLAETTIYTCPATKRATVYLHCANTDAALARTVTLYNTQGGAGGGLDTVVAGESLATKARQTYGPFTLEPGDIISGLSDAADKVAVKVASVEVTIE